MANYLDVPPRTPQQIVARTFAGLLSEWMMYPATAALFRWGWCAKCKSSGPRFLFGKCAVCGTERASAGTE